MRRVLGFCITVALFSALLIVSAVAQSQVALSLRELARQQRQAKKGPAATKMYTNENLPTKATINVTGVASAPDPAPGKAEGTTAAKADAKADPFAPDRRYKMPTKYLS